MRAPWKVALALAAAIGCYGVPNLSGPYRCADDGSCEGEGFVCHDGICCRPDGPPLCLSYAFPDGGCFDGGAATLLYADFDHDGFGNETQQRLFCGPPVTESYVERAGDCNDNPNAGGEVDFPGAPEQCDGFDNDCDGVPDNGLQRQWFYLDEDGDAFGAPDAGLFLCKPRTGYVQPSGDCDPADPTVFPGAPDLCNGRDDNCNGVVDEGGPVWYRDTDKDGYGVATVTRTACARPSGYAAKSGDCDDAVAGTNPGVADVCDGVDNNCVGGVDERPDCRGPLDLLAGVDLTRGAGALDTSWNGAAPHCLKDDPVARPDAFTGKVWVGTGATSHLAWIEAAKTWDLTNTKLTFDFRQFFNGATGNPAWSNHKQPVVLLCHENGTFARYVPAMDGGSAAPPLMPTSGESAQTVMPIGGGQGWVVGVGSNLSDYKHVKRVEILIQPNINASGSSPSFSFTFDKLGF